MNIPEKFSFEEAYARLEKILNTLNSGNESLEKSLQLYEEANNLITLCGSKLNKAEQKIQTLIKNRNGDLILNEDEERKPKLKSFIHSTEQGM